MKNIKFFKNTLNANTKEKLSIFEHFFWGGGEGGHVTWAHKHRSAENVVFHVDGQNSVEINRRFGGMEDDAIISTVIL